MGMLPAMVLEHVWKQNRERALRKLREHLEKGLVDKDIVFLLDLLNAYPFIYTTSSCSGRIGLMRIPPSRKKHECERLGKRHEPVEPEVVISTLHERLNSKKDREGFVVLKQEPPILDIAVKTLDKAQRLLSAGRAAGFKNSGVKSYNPQRGFEALVELRSTERLDVPVARPDYVVSDEYLERVVKLANENLLRAKEKLRRLYEYVIQFFGEPPGAQGRGREAF